VQIFGLTSELFVNEKLQFTFFTFANMILTILFLIMFITIELEFFKNYLVRNWPAFSSTSTFTVLACGQIIVGFQILEMVTRSDYRNTVVGGAMYGIGISAGCLLVTIGWLYIIIVSILPQKNFFSLPFSVVYLPKVSLKSI